MRKGLFVTGLFGIFSCLTFALAKGWYEVPTNPIELNVLIAATIASTICVLQNVDLITRKK